jgi:hypothetical protein
MDENKLSLTEKPRWEILAESKLIKLGVNEKFLPTIVKGIELFAPMVIILIPCLISGLFSSDKKE